MIERYFTKQSFPADFAWKTIDITLKNAEGETIYSQENAHFPESFSQTACEIIASKYFYRGTGESDYKELVSRMVGFWKEALLDEGILGEDEAEIFDDEVSFMLFNQLWAPNSPQWFNTGVPKDLEDDLFFYYDGESISTAKKGDNRSQSSACFILDVKDKLIGKGSITDHYVTETKLFKGGSGCGSNFSTLRAKGERLSSGGSSSGLMSYLKGLDVNAGTIKSGGTTRRAAKMVLVDIDHPEIEEFIDWKVKEEEKAKALINAGYDASIGGEAYNTVSGQNSNTSVSVSDDFMRAYREDTEWELTGRVDSEANKRVKARYLFDKLSEAAWACGDPGIRFADKIEEWNSCKNSGKINASNPCGEFVFLDNSACNLSSINLERFLDEQGVLDLKGLEQAVKLAQLVMEASIHWGLYPTPEIAENSYKFRPTGLGITGLAGFLEKSGLAYDSERARDWAGAICNFLTAKSYEISTQMAERAGSFEGFEENKSVIYQIIKKHCDSLIPLKDSKNGRNGYKSLIFAAFNSWEKVQRAVADGKLRNAQVTCIAPTGTISLVMDASSTGIEPYYSRKTIKKLADGSTIEKEIKAIKTAYEINPLDHVKMVAAIQPHISGAISKTVNLPNDASVEDVKDIFLNAYELGCKSITIYRDGSKGTQVLSIDKDEKKEKSSQFEIKLEPERLKPGGIRDSRTHSAVIGDIQLYITVGYYDDGSIAEIFINTDKQGEVVNGLLVGLSKTLSHLLQYGVKPEKISKILSGQKYEPAGVVARHPNIKLADSISDLIARVLEIECGDYRRSQVKPDTKTILESVARRQKSLMMDSRMDDYEAETVPYREKWDKQEVKVYGESCTTCGSTNLVRSGTCKTCTDCGTTTGCG